MRGQTVANSNDKKRRDLDFYPTPAEVTFALLDFLKLEPCRIWECACGTGSMSEALKQRGHKVFSSDIAETGYGKADTDFLRSELICDAVITNPPFATSELFIRHALTQAPIVAMVLKSQYWHAAKRAKLFEDWPPAYVLPLTWRPDFLFDQRAAGDKSASTMDVLWTVWIAGQIDTQYRVLKRPAAK